MRLEIDGRVAVVSGGSAGIGRAVATELAAEGAHVLVAARTKERIDAVVEEIRAAGGRAEGHAGDMTTAEGVAAAVGAARQRFGPVGIAVSNVIGHVIDPGKEGSGPGAERLAGLDPADLSLEYERLLASSWLLADAVLPDMRRAGWGRIVNIGSRVAREPRTDIPHVLPNLVRPAVAAAHRSWAEALRGTGITVNSVLTGSIATERNASYWRFLAAERGQSEAEVLAATTAGIPQRRMGDPGDIGALVAFLCSPAGGAVSGQSIPVDGGSSRHL